MMNLIMLLRVALTVYLLVMVGIHSYWAVTAFCVLVALMLEVHNHVLLQVYLAFSAIGDWADETQKKRTAR